MTQWAGLIGSIVGALIAAAVAVLLNRRKAKAEATDVITQAAERAVLMVSADNGRLRVQLDGLIEQSRQQSDRISALTLEVHGLRKQIETLENENLSLMAKLAALDPQTFREQG